MEKSEPKLNSKEEIRRMMRLTSAKMQSQNKAGGKKNSAAGQSSGVGDDSVKSHPFARFNSLNQLTCILCGCVLKSTLLWKPHLASKQHRANAEALKRQGEEKAVDILSGAGIKRKQAATAAAAAAPASSLQVGYSSSSEEEEAAASAAGESAKSAAKKLRPSANKSLPSNFFDAATSRSSSSSSSSKEKQAASSSRSSSNAASGSTLPEGFFDDPYADAKARHVPYKDKMEEEMELFTKQIRDTEVESEQIAEAAEEESETVRRLDEIIAQEKTWHRLNELEHLCESAAKKEAMNIKQEANSGDDSDLSDSQLDFGVDSFSWRKKQL